MPTYPVYEGPHKTDKAFFMFERSEFEKRPVLFGPKWDRRRAFWYFLSVQKVRGNFWVLFTMKKYKNEASVSGGPTSE